MTKMPRGPTFGGIVTDGHPFSRPERFAAGAQGILCDFLHYLGSTWIYEFAPPTSSEALARFDIRPAIHAFRQHLSSGGTVSTHEGLDLEQSYHLLQIIARRPLLCLINAGADESYDSIPAERVRQFAPESLIMYLNQNYLPALDIRTSIENQLSPRRASQNQYAALVYDGQTGHCITLVGKNQQFGRIVIWDPWPFRSLLCSENNLAGVAAQPTPDSDLF